MHLMCVLLFCVGVASTSDGKVPDAQSDVNTINSFPSPIPGLQIEILHPSIAPQLPSLVYHGEGDCEWGLIIIATRSNATAITGTDGRRLQIDNVSLIFKQPVQ